MAKGRGDGVILDAGDDAVAIPMAEPGGRLIAAIVLGKIERPGAMLANVGDDAAQEAACVGVGGFDEERNFKRRLHKIESAAVGQRFTRGKMRQSRNWLDDQRRQSFNLRS